MLPKPWEQPPPKDMPAWKANMPPPKPKAPGASLVANGRRKPGRPRAIPDADALLDAADAYIKWADENPILKNRSQLHDGKPIKWTEQIKRPLTKMGFQAFLGISERTMYRLLHDEVNERPEIAEVAAAIFAMFDSDLLEGGVVKLYDGPLVSRVLQLADTVNSNVPPPTGGPSIDPKDIPNLVHPDDPDPFGENPLRFSQRQLDAGVPYPAKVIEHE